MKQQGVNVRESAAPELLEEGVWIWQAFLCLSEKRLVNEAGPQPIPVSEIAAYADYERVRGEIDREDLLYLITVMDRLWLEEAYKQRQARARKAAGEAKQRARNRKR